ncbi:unnamed protein product, partial [Mesorhabditis spiculigera]
MSRVNSLPELPREQLLPILRHLDFRSLTTLRQCCRKMDLTIREETQKLAKRLIPAIKISFDEVKHCYRVAIRNPDDPKKTTLRHFGRKRKMQTYQPEKRAKWDFLGQEMLDAETPSTSGQIDRSHQIVAYLEKMVHGCEVGSLILEELDLECGLMEKLRVLFAREEIRPRRVKLEFCRITKAEELGRFVSTLSPCELTLSYIRDLDSNPFKYLESTTQALEFLDVSNLSFMRQPKKKLETATFLGMLNTPTLCLDVPGDISNKKFVKIWQQKASMARLNWRICLSEDADIEVLQRTITRIDDAVKISVFRKNCVDLVK